jgi:LacI family transcriptional regulator
MKTRQRVLDAISELGYRPNRLARALSGRQSYVLGLIVPDISNPFCAELARTIEDEAEANGYALVLGNSEQNAERELKYVRTFLDHKIDGLFLVSGSSSRRLSALSAEIHKPCILLDRSLNYPKSVNFFGVDGAAGAYEATRYILSLGHKRIVALCGPVHLGVDRAKGYSRAMEDAGLRPDVRHAEKFERLAAYNLARKILAHPRRPTAIFATNDVAAISVLRAAMDLGLAVPADLSVVGFDDIQEARYSVPRLTTVAQPIAELGRMAIVHLVGLIGEEAHASREPRAKLVKPRLIVRESCGPIKIENLDRAPISPRRSVRRLRQSAMHPT